MDLDNSRAAQLYYRVLEKYVCPRIEVLGLRPNGVSLLGLGLAVLVPLGFWLAAILGVLLMGLSAVADGLDGYLARQRKEKTRFGAFLDSTLDRAADFFYLLGFWVYSISLGSGSLWFTLCIFLALLATLLISYSKARIEGLGGRCAIGLMHRAPRTLYLLAWGILLVLLPPLRVYLLWIGILVYLLLTLATVWQRVRLAAVILDQEEESV